MNKYICISSQGEIEVDALSLIGASTKRNDESKIGYFGSGNKYALTALLRNNIPFKIFSGVNEIKVTTELVTFRNETFNRIIVNDKSTSLTTDMGGKFWDDGFPIIRELYSNALDEGNANIDTINVILPSEGTTKFYIENTSLFNEIIANLDDYFLINTTPIWKNKSIEIYDNNLKEYTIFRKGIKATNLTKTIKGIYYYSISNIEVNESRLIDDLCIAQNKIVNGLVKCEDINIIKKLITNLNGSNNTYYEHKCIESSIGKYSKIIFSKEWHEAMIKNKYVSVEALMFIKEDLNSILHEYIVLPYKLLYHINKQFPDIRIRDFENSGDGEFIEVTPNIELVDLINDSINILQKSKYAIRIPSKYELKFGHFTDSRTLAQAKVGDVLIPQVRISTKLQLKTINEIIPILIEEYEHLNSGEEDYTRAFQNHLLKLYVNLLTS